MFSQISADSNRSKYPSSEECLKAIAFLADLGCAHVKETKKVSVFSTPNSRMFCVIWEADGVRRDRSIGEERLALAFDPALTESRILAAGIPALKISEGYCNSNMTCFPKVSHGDKTPISTATKVTLSGIQNIRRMITLYKGL